MAIIGKIREKSWLLVGVIGLALVAFILTDFLSGSNRGQNNIGIGTVYDSDVDYAEYDKNVKLFLADARATAQKEQRDINQQEQDQAYDQAWSYTVDNLILQKEYDALGINVSEAEFKAYLLGKDGFEVLPDIAKGFTDSVTGAVNTKLLESKIKELSTSKDAEAKKNWAQTKKYYTERRRTEKYFDILGQGIYVTKLEGKADYKAKKEVKEVSYISKSYGDFKKKDVKVSDAELLKYYEDHKEDKKYQNIESSRTVRLFDIPVVPSKKDSADLDNNIAKLKTEFQSSSDDSSFIVTNSDDKNFFPDRKMVALPQNNPKAKQGNVVYPFNMDSTFKSAKIGQVVGPFVSDGKITLSKITGSTPSSVSARHILIATNQSTDSAVLAQKKGLADSIMRVVNKGNFEALVKKHTDDPGSKDKGGKYEDFLATTMVVEFGDYCANAPIGKIGLVKTDFGYHIIEVLKRSSEKYPTVVSVVKNFSPSSETKLKIEDLAYDMIDVFDKELAKIEDISKRSNMFDTLSRKKGYAARKFSIKNNKPDLMGANFAQSFTGDKLLKFAYDSDVEAGTLIGAPIKDKGKYVIAYLSLLTEKGTPSFEDVKLKMKEDLMKQKQFDFLSKKIAKDKSLKAMAKRLGLEIQTAEVTFDSPKLGQGSYDPIVVGSIFSSIKDGQRTKAIKGTSGVFVVKINKTTKAPVAKDYKEEITKALTDRKTQLQGAAMQSLRKKANVIDSRRFNRLRISIED